MWKDFHRHFGDAARRTTPQNHHDFLDAYKNARESGDFSAYPHSRAHRLEDAAGEYALGQDRITRAHRNYNKMKLASITIPVHKTQVNKNNDALILKGRQRQKEQDDKKRKKEIEWLKSMQSAEPPKSPLRTRAIKLADEFKKRVFPERHLFVVIDGQDLFKTKDLKFAYVEINARLCKAIPQKVWDSQGAQRLDLYQRIELAKPSKLLMKQIILETIDEVNTRLDMQNSPMYCAWQLDGSKIKSFMDIHQNCRVIVVSPDKDFKGIQGLE